MVARKPLEAAAIGRAEDEAGAHYTQRLGPGPAPLSVQQLKRPLTDQHRPRAPQRSVNAATVVRVGVRDEHHISMDAWILKARVELDRQPFHFNQQRRSVAGAAHGANPL